ncbi:MAG: glycosyltransferase [Pseudomonadota bacterium]
MSGRHIAFMLPDLGGGGAERVTLALADQFVSEGDRVDLVLLQDTGPLVDAVPASLNRIVLNAPGRLRAVPAIARYMRQARPDGFVSAMSSFNCLAVMARMLAGVQTRLLLTEHNMVSPHVAQKWTHRVLPPLIRRLYPRADRVLAVGTDVADDLAVLSSIPRDRIAVVYNAVVTPELLARTKRAADHPWFAPGAPPVVLSVGQMIPRKDYPTLIRAFALLREKIDCRLLILGEGPDRAALEALVAELDLADAVSLPGFAPDPMPYLAACGVFVLSSRSEGLPTVIIEAMAAGARIVGTDGTGGTRELLDDGRLGTLVPVGDPSALAQALEAALSSEQAPEYPLHLFEAATTKAHYERLLFPD